MFSKRLFLKSTLLYLSIFLFRKNLHASEKNQIIYLKDKECTWILSKEDTI